MWISVKEARERINGAVCVGTLYALVKRGSLAATKVAGRILIDSDDLADMIAMGRIAAITARRATGRPRGA